MRELSEAVTVPTIRASLALNLCNNKAAEIDSMGRAESINLLNLQLI